MAAHLRLPHPIGVYILDNNEEPFPPLPEEIAEFFDGIPGNCAESHDFRRGFFSGLKQTFQDIRVQPSDIELALAVQILHILQCEFRSAFLEYSTAHMDMEMELHKQLTDAGGIEALKSSAKWHEVNDQYDSALGTMIAAIDMLPFHLVAMTIGSVSCSIKGEWITHDDAVTTYSAIRQTWEAEYQLPQPQLESCAAIVSKAAGAGKFKKIGKGKGMQIGALSFFRWIMAEQRKQAQKHADGLSLKAKRLKETKKRATVEWENRNGIDGCKF